MENNTKAFARIANITSPYRNSEKELVERVNFVKTVIRNTMAKFPTELRPEELSWVSGGTGVRYTGFEFRDSKGNTVEITDENPITHNHVFSFYAIGRKGWNSEELTVRRVSFPAHLLFNDPMAIAQYARKLIRSKQASIRYQEAMDTTKKVEDVNKQIAKLEQERTKLEDQKKEINRRNQQAREAIKKNQAKQEKRRATKLLKSNS